MKKMKKVNKIYSLPKKCMKKGRYGGWKFEDLEKTKKICRRSTQCKREKTCSYLQAILRKRGNKSRKRMRFHKNKNLDSFT